MNKLLLTCLKTFCLLSIFTQTHTFADDDYNKWLEDKFSDQHQALIPVVAVANIFAGCNKARKFDPIQYQVKDLVLKMSRDELSSKTLSCLQDDDIQSEVAIDFGLMGCFRTQFSHLSIPERLEKMQQVGQALKELSLEERKKSFTQCTTFLAIEYLK